MGDSSTCLLRSFSTPSETSCVPQEGNPLRALGESVSFGRFMSESLDWEKWSTFSHNRYVEEAEKYSKPGTVAAKKAYFEAHYKKKAAERAAALIQEANAQANETSGSETLEGISTATNIEMDSQENAQANGTSGSETQEGTCPDSNIEMDSQANAQAHGTSGSETQEGTCPDSNIEMDSQGNAQAHGTSGSETQEGTCPDSNIEMDSRVNAQANGTSGSETQEGACIDSNIEMDLQADNIVMANEQPDKETYNYLVVDSIDAKQHEHDPGEVDLGISIVEESDNVPHPCVDTNLNAESSVLVDNSNQSDHVEVHKNIAVPVGERTSDLGIASKEVLASPTVKGREVDSSLNLSTRTRAAKLPHSLDERKAAAAMPPRSGINSASKGKKPVVNSVEKKRLTTRSLRMSINLPSGNGETTKKTASASQPRNSLNRFSTSRKSPRGSVEKKRITAPSLFMSISLPSGEGLTSKTATATVLPRNRINFAPKFVKSVGDSTEKITTARSLHMSIDLTSGAGETRKRDSVLEHNRIRKVNSNLPKDHPVASRTSTKASHGLLNQASANLPSQGRRTEKLNKSVSGGVTANAKPSSISADCLKSPRNTKSNSQPATISLPFRFRSEERAVKRKELLQRMDENKSKEEEKVQLQRTTKGKPEHDHKKLRQSIGSQSKQSEDKSDGSQSPSNQIRKSSLALPRSPKLGRKASSSKVQDKNLGNSWKPPISTKNSKRVTEKTNRQRQSVTSLSNTTRENASPNIQN